MRAVPESLFGFAICFLALCSSLIIMKLLLRSCPFRTGLTVRVDISIDLSTSFLGLDFFVSETFLGSVFFFFRGLLRIVTGGVVDLADDFIVTGRLRIRRRELLESIEYVEFVRAKLMFDEVFVVSFDLGLILVSVLIEDFDIFDLTTTGAETGLFGFVTTVMRTVFSSFLIEFFNNLSLTYVTVDVFIVLPIGVFLVNVVVVSRSLVCGL